MAAQKRFDVNIADYFAVYLDSLSRATITELFSVIISAWPDNSPEKPIMKNETDLHARFFYEDSAKYVEQHFHK